MSLELILLIYVVIPLSLGLGTYLVKSQISRIDKLEDRLNNVLTEMECRQIISDKLEPIRVEVTEIKKYVERNFPLYSCGKCGL